MIEYTWDYRNRLVNITTKTSGGTVTHEVDYTYDIFNRRIGKTVDADGAGAGTATEEIYIYGGLRQERGAAGDHILLAFDESDDLTDRFLYGPNVDQVLASEEVTSTASAGDVLWALTDHLGTVRDVADYNAGTDTTTVQNHLTYDAFGNITAETNAAVDFLFAFTGRERDEESDLQYNRARYYDAAIGKWISEDPIGFDAGDENLVRYVNNVSPLAVDPSGRETAYHTGHGDVSGAVWKVTGDQYVTYEFETTNSKKETVWKAAGRKITAGDIKKDNGNQREVSFDFFMVIISSKMMARFYLDFLILNGSGFGLQVNPTQP